MNPTLRQHYRPSEPHARMAPSHLGLVLSSTLNFLLPSACRRVAVGPQSHERPIASRTSRPARGHRPDPAAASY